jgi:cyclase
MPTIATAHSGGGTNMDQTTDSRGRTAPWMAGAALALALTAGASAQPAVAPATAAPAPEVKQLSPDTYVLIGQSGNVVIVPTPEGALIVDDERARDVPEILAAVHQLTPGPVRYAINTHWHLDHSGGNEALARTGTVIVAQRNVRERRAVEQYMPAYKNHIPPAPAFALPAVVFDDRLELNFGDERLRLLHTPNAHTDGDTLVWLPKANVLHMGDVYFHGIWPFIDRASGGSVQGVIKSVDIALALANDQTRIVPAHGAIASKAELKAYGDMLKDVTAKVKQGIRAHKTLAQIVASRPAAAYAHGMEGDENRLIETIYDSLIKG